MERLLTMKKLMFALLDGRESLLSSDRNVANGHHHYDWPDLSEIFLFLSKITIFFTPLLFLIDSDIHRREKSPLLVYRSRHRVRIHVCERDIERSIDNAGGNRVAFNTLTVLFRIVFIAVQSLHVAK